MLGSASQCKFFSFFVPLFLCFRSNFHTCELSSGPPKAPPTWQCTNVKEPAVPWDSHHVVHKPRTGSFSIGKVLAKWTRLAASERTAVTAKPTSRWTIVWIFPPNWWWRSLATVGVKTPKSGSFFFFTVSLLKMRYRVWSEVFDIELQFQLAVGVTWQKRTVLGGMFGFTLPPPVCLSRY